MKTSKQVEKAKDPLPPLIVRPASRVVAIVTSAGGLDALTEILATLPADFLAAIVVVQHIEADRPSLLAPILSRRTSLCVKEAEEGDVLRAGYVYTAPPGKHLLVNTSDTLSLSVTAKEHFSRPAGDVLLRSVAESCRERGIGIVLTGGDGDGATGIKAIKAAGGKTIAQAKAGCLEFSMPRTAIDTGDVDSVLSLEDIAACLMSLA